VIGTASLLCVALLGQAQPHTYYWRDAAGQTHITNTPPPVDAELLEAPPPTAVEPGRPGNLDLIRPSAVRSGPSQMELTPTQKQDWEALDKYLAQARARPLVEREEQAHSISQVTTSSSSMSTAAARPTSGRRRRP